MGVVEIASVRRLGVVFVLATLFTDPSRGEDKSHGKNLRDEVIHGLKWSEEAEKPRSTEIRIVSYNVQARPILDRAEEKLPKISPLLEPFDVVLVQECFTRHDLLWASNDFPNKVYFGKPRRGSVTNSGLSILARLPMSKVVQEHYKDVGEIQNRAASKGVLMVRLQVAGSALDVYDTHMEAGASEAAQRARQGQVRQLIEFVRRNSSADDAVVLMGDFNMGPRRAGKGWREYSHRHYSSEADTLARTDAFEKLRAGLELRDAADESYGPIDDGIERMLFRDSTKIRITPLECKPAREGFSRPDGTSLSDGSPLIGRLSFEPISK